jgi:hypothetical protein
MKVMSEDPAGISEMDYVPQLFLNAGIGRCI